LLDISEGWHGSCIITEICIVIDDVDVTRQLLAVKHGDLELLLSFYVLINFTVCLFLCTFVRFS